MLMATSDNQIQMALDSDWIDMFIPFHASSLPKAVWYNMRAWKDYTTVQNEAFLNGDEMRAALISDGVELPKSIKAADVERMYLEHFNIKTIIGTAGKQKGRGSGLISFRALPLLTVSMYRAMTTTPENICNCAVSMVCILASME